MNILTNESILKKLNSTMMSGGYLIYLVQLLPMIANIYFICMHQEIYYNREIYYSITWISIRILYNIILFVISIFTVLLINDIYDEGQITVKSLIRKSIIIFPRYLKGMIIFYVMLLGGIVVGTIIVGLIIVLLSIMISKSLEYIIYISTLVTYTYLAVKFPLIGYILILEKKTNFIKRSRQMYKSDRNLVLKFAVITSLVFGSVLCIALSPTIMEISRNVDVIIKVSVKIFYYIATPIVNIVGLIIYRSVCNNKSGRSPDFNVT